MFKPKALVAKSLTVLGKSLIILTISFNAPAVEAENPHFFKYRTSQFTDQLVEFSFGWFKTLSEEQSQAYHSALNHAVMFADNGQSVSWYKNDASGFAVPVITWPTSNGYCRRIHIQAIAYNTEKIMAATACFEDITDRWTWNSDKY
jgi:surface antigen